MPDAAPSVKHMRFPEHHVQADIYGRAFKAPKCSIKHVLVYQVLTCQLCGSMHVDKGKYKKFNRISHKC